MSVSELDQFYLNQKEPAQSCMIALREIILSFDKSITAEWKYKLPFFYYQGKMLCYIWKRKDQLETPYLGFMDGKAINHPSLKLEKRKRVMTIDINPLEDIEIELIHTLLQRAISHKKSQLKLK